MKDISLKTAVAISAPSLALLVAIFLLVRWWWVVSAAPDDVIGNASRVSKSCQLEDHPAVANGKGYVAVVREANCPCCLSQGRFYYVVFVHPSNVPNDATNLVYQYEPTYDLNGKISPPPRVIWTGHSSLGIVTGIVDEAIKERFEIGRIQITYAHRAS